MEYKNHVFVCLFICLCVYVSVCVRVCVCVCVVFRRDTISMMDDHILLVHYQGLWPRLKKKKNLIPCSSISRCTPRGGGP